MTRRFTACLVFVLLCALLAAAVGKTPPERLPTARLRDGVVYLPVAFTASWFGAKISATKTGMPTALTLGAHTVHLPVRDTKGKAVPSGYLPVMLLNTLLPGGVRWDAHAHVYRISTPGGGKQLTVNARTGVLHEDTPPHVSLPTTTEPEIDHMSLLDPEGKTSDMHGKDVTPTDPKVKYLFVRGKYHGTAWNANPVGTKRFLAFVQPFLPFAAEFHTIALPNIAREQTANNQRYPLLYLSCDQSFLLTPDEIAALRRYLKTGGFLFLDSAPLPAVVTRVKAVMRQVTGHDLQPIPTEHPLNTCLFQLSTPGVGENAHLLPRVENDRQNFGIVEGERLIVFYSPGNFMHLFALCAPDAHPYFTAQYQMGANIAAYALQRGEPLPVRYPGANATATVAVCEYLDILNSTPLSLKVEKQQ